MGEYYADYDDTTACWGVFHTDKRPGHCYALFTTEQEATEWVQNRFHRTFGLKLNKRVT